MRVSGWNAGQPIAGEILVPIVPHCHPTSGPLPFYRVSELPPAARPGRDPVAPEWCLVCHTRHPVEVRCPGRLAATGAEREGWKVVVETPHSVEAMGVLVAPSGSLWRARIITYPRSLWTVPGGHGTMKFVARTPQLAEEQAIRYVEEHCAVRGFQPRHGLDVVVGSRNAATSPASVAAVARTSATPRWPQVLPVIFGLDAPMLRAVTRNVSEGGIFVQTPTPVGGGADLRLHLTVRKERLPMEGVVVWSRAALQPGRPPGMGVRLVTPPGAYLDYVRSLPAPAPAEGF